jgi:hypothetical protein
MPTVEELARDRELADVAGDFRAKCAEFIALQRAASKLRVERDAIELQRQVLLSRIEDAENDVAELRCKLLAIASGENLAGDSPVDERYER